jgi:alkylhydroperoxidase/carboxymuconolactone decarboxylase family protein YurZ
MFPELDEIRKTRKKYNLQMRQSGIGAFRSLSEMEAGALKDGALTQKQKELIALGISLSQSCYG